MNEKELKKFLETVAKLPAKSRLIYLEKVLKEEKDKEIIKLIEKEIEKTKTEIIESREWKREGVIQETRVDLSETVKEKTKTTETPTVSAKSLENIVLNMAPQSNEDDVQKTIKYASPGITAYKAESSYKASHYESAHYEPNTTKNFERPLFDQEPQRTTSIPGNASLERLRESEEITPYKKKK